MGGLMGGRMGGLMGGLINSHPKSVLKLFKMRHGEIIFGKSLYNTLYTRSIFFHQTCFFKYKRNLFISYTRYVITADQILNLYFRWQFSRIEKLDSIVKDFHNGISGMIPMSGSDPANILLLK